MCRGRRERQGEQLVKWSRSNLDKKMRGLDVELKKWGGVWKGRTGGEKAKKLS